MILSEYIRLLQGIEFEHGGNLEVLDWDQLGISDDVRPEIRHVVPVFRKHGATRFRLDKNGMKACLI